jgi:hypothetical protein
VRFPQSVEDCVAASVASRGGKRITTPA